MQPRTINTARLALYWFGIQMVWGALLGVSLQARSAELAGTWPLDAYKVLATAGAAVAAITQIGAGVLSDRYAVRGSTRVPFYYAGAAIGAAGIAWFYAAPVFGQLLAALIVLQFGMNIAIGPYQAAIPDAVEEPRHGNASSWMAALQSAGNACGAVVAGLVNDVRIVAAVIVAALLSSCAFTATHVKNARPIERSVMPVRLDRAYVDLFVSRALVYLGFYTLLGYLFFFISQTLARHDAKATTGYTLLAVTAAGTLGAALAARPTDRFDQRGVASVAAAAFALLILALLFTQSAAAVIAVATIAGAAWGVFLTADWALGCRFVPHTYAATALGVWNLALLIPQVLAPLIAGFAIALLHARFGSGAHAAFVAAILEVALGSIWVWRLPARTEIPVRKPLLGNNA